MYKKILIYVGTHPAWNIISKWERGQVSRMILDAVVAQYSDDETRRRRAMLRIALDESLTETDSPTVDGAETEKPCHEQPETIRNA